MKIALIGLPQAGRKTLFTLLTGRTVPEVRKPGESVEGIAAIRDERVDRLTDLFKPKRKVYAENHFVLCPDAVTGADSRGWLDAARRCDLLCLVVRAFDSDQVYHPEGSVDAARDEENLRTELLFADMELVEKRLVRMAKEARAGVGADQKTEQETLKTCMAALEAGQPLTSLTFDPTALASIRSLGLLTLIPLMVLHNVSEADLGKAAVASGGPLALSCQIEQEIAGIDRRRGRTAGIHGGDRHPPAGAGPRERGGLRRAGTDVLLHRRQGRMPGLDHPQGLAGTGGGRQDP